jgi:hypothetical protein
MYSMHVCVCSSLTAALDTISFRAPHLYIYLFIYYIYTYIYSPRFCFVPPTVLYVQLSFARWAMAPSRRSFLHGTEQATYYGQRGSAALPSFRCEDIYVVCIYMCVYMCIYYAHVCIHVCIHICVRVRSEKGDEISGMWWYTWQVAQDRGREARALQVGGPFKQTTMGFKWRFKCVNHVLLNIQMSLTTDHRL